MIRGTLSLRFGGAVVGMALTMAPATALALPNPGPLEFAAPTPAAGALVTATSQGIRLDAACTFDPDTLAVSLNGTPIPASSFLPFGPCASGRMQSQTVNAGITLPSTTITGGPTSLNAGQNGTYTGTGSGDALGWNFDGGAQPGTGGSILRTFKAAGTFTVRLRATTNQSLDASGLAGGNLVAAQRTFLAGDATPDTRQLAVAMPADVDFTNFESAHTHPLALSSGGTQLYAVNTPENRLAIFNVDAGNGSLAFVGDVPVGMDPVSVAVSPVPNEAWVVNHLSDTISIVDTAARRVVGSIAVGDEPTDVVFASGRAFVTLAGNQDKLRVYNATTRALVTSLDLFGDDPRALATNAAGTEVYAVVLESGNKTTILFHSLVTQGGGPPAPAPPRNPALGSAPTVGLIVKFNPAQSKWRDEVGTKDWTSFVNFSLPDNDVFVIDADATTPSLIRTVSGVGTILFDLAVNPANGNLWVSNTDARNLIRFEPNLRGHLVETRISIVNPTTSTVSPVNVNTHINFAVTPGSAGEIAQSLAHPGQGVFNAAGSTFYLTAFGSRKVGVLNGAGVVTARIDVGGGPSGVALKESASRLYVMNRFDNTISTVDTGSNTQVGVIGVAGASAFDPSPDIVRTGRKFLYDGATSSGHGDTACATCHVFSNFDNLAWDLGDPQGAFTPFSTSTTPWVAFATFLGPSTTGFDPMKGPMTTQTLRGLKDMEPFHWRGDRQNFQHFNAAFIGLMGRSAQLSTADMDAFTAFIETVKFPPNPFRNLDDTMPSSILVPNQTGGGALVAGNPNTGATKFSAAASPLDAGFFQCVTCHALPTGTSNLLFNGNAEGESQDFKIPHLRNMYEKVGFDVIRPNLQGNPPTATNIGTATMKKGFGFLHDGSVSMTEFQAAPVFISTTQEERDEFAFMLAFPTETRPSVGAQVAVDASNKTSAAVTIPIGQLVAQANLDRCDLVVKGTIGGVAKGWAFDTVSGMLVPDSLVEVPLTEAALRGSVAGSDVLVYTGVPNNAGTRLGIDRDRDGWLDRSETALGYDPADPNSNPWQF